jgi:octanoyl-[GcvH]:protein N-octanoyltransferase
MHASDFPAHWGIVDESAHALSGDILVPFALDELLCDQVGAGAAPPLLHLWRHNRAFVLGLRDRKLPNAAHAMERLRTEGYAVGVRHSGGAAVPLDAGVLNVSLILPKPHGSIHYHDDFERMRLLIGKAVKALGVDIEKGEIVGSYCPGEYDLSIRGRKFCGIAQRRKLKAYIIQAFIVVDGSGEERARIAEDFYSVAAGNGGGTHPVVDRASIGSLCELSESSIDVSAFASILKTAACTWGKGAEYGNAAHFGISTAEVQHTAKRLKEKYDN